MRRLAQSLVLPLVLLSLGVYAPLANADVLIDTSDLNGACPTLGIWYQSYSGGPRSITAAIFHGKKLVVRRHLKATTTWRFYTLACPEPPGHYVVLVAGAGWHASYRVHVFGHE